MNRNICIYQEFLTEAHKDQIRETARRTGFTPHFLTWTSLRRRRTASSTARFCTPIPLTFCAPLPLR